MELKFQEKICQTCQKIKEEVPGTVIIKKELD